MKIVVNGHQAFGKSVLEALLDRGDDVIAVYCEPDREDARPDPIKVAAEEHGLPVYQPASYKKAEVWAAFAELNPDLCVMAFVTKIVPEEFLYIPTHGTIQYHPSLLPRHRGPSSINWPIIQGADKTGLTIFWPDNGLDTGPVLLQREVAITANDTLGSIYFDQLFPMGVAAMLESVDLVKAGKALKIVQNEADATYESWCRADDVAIDWTQPAAVVHNLIRGADPRQYLHLPLVVGTGAELAAADILPLIEARPRLRDRTEALIRVDERRWDIRLKDGGLIRLPADGAEAALIQLDALDQRHQLFERGCELVDLKVPGTLGLRPAELAGDMATFPLAAGGL